MNYSKKFTICMLVYLRLIQQTKGAIEPSISDLTELSRNCSNFCLPYGSCCTGFEFCHDGSCENCFPKNVTDENLPNWCRDIGQHDSSKMRHPYSCIKACQNRFNATDLMLCEADRSDSTKSNCSNKESSDLVLCEETWKNVAICVIALASVEGLLLLVLAVWIVNRYCALKGKKTQDSNANSLYLANRSQIKKKPSSIQGPTYETNGTPKRSIYQWRFRRGCFLQ